MSLSVADLQQIEVVAARLRNCSSVLVITGAGLSADSGVPTYRGIGGLYEESPDAEGVPIEVLLSAEGMRRDPARVWSHLRHVEASCRGMVPNRGHAVIAAMEQAFERVWVLTQNVDGFHQRAGSRHVIAIHGNVHKVRCTACSYRTGVESYAELGEAPVCPSCGADLRPDVVLFGEMLDADAVGLYQQHLDQPFDVVFSIGTSSLFSYIQEPVLDAAMFDRFTVEINPGDTEVSQVVDVHLRLPAEAALVALWQCYGGTLP